MSEILPTVNRQPPNGPTMKSFEVLDISHDPRSVPYAPSTRAIIAGTSGLVSLGPCSEIIKKAPEINTK